MSEDLKSEAIGDSQRPRSPRVPVDFAIKIEGKTSGGKPFQEQATAVKVSRGGATIKTDVEVLVGEIVRVTPPFGRTLEAEVNGVWSDETDGAQRIGVKLLDENGWFAE